MRKRIFFPIFILLISFPLLIFLLSYTRVFNEELRSVLTSVVDEQTNAKLYLGEIHGSILGSFRIDGAALYYRGDPIALIDTIKISHLPLSLITKTVQVTNVEFVNPRFYLTRYKDGTYNVDHISKAAPKPGGKFDWTVLLNAVRIKGGEFSLYDSIDVERSRSLRSPQDPVPDRRFDASDFHLKNIDLTASAILSGDNLTANVKNISLALEQPSFRIDSLKFGLFTSQGGTEISGFRLISNSTLVHADLTLIGQNLLDSLDVEYFRQKHFTVNLDARRVDLKQVKEFIDIPVDPVSKIDLSLFASGDLDTLNLKQFLLRTDSSYVPIAARFYNIVDPSMAMRINAADARVNMAELSGLLRTVGFPDVGELSSMQLSATADGTPSDLDVGLELKNGKTEISGSSRIYSSSYDGQIAFRGVDLGKILKGSGLKTQLTGIAKFSLKSNGTTIPDGKVALSIDSSSYDHTTIQSVSVNASSVNDSIYADVNLLTSKGNIDGETSLDVATETYTGDLAFAELDVAPFVHVPTLEGNFTGRLRLAGNGFNIDSLKAQVSLFTERASLDGFQMNNSAFTVELNTQQSDKNLRVRSPFLDADANGEFVPHELPTQLSTIFSALADSFSSEVTGRHDTVGVGFPGVANLDASLDVKVKDGRFLGKLLGNTKLYGDPEAHLRLLSDSEIFSMNGSVAAKSLGLSEDSLRISASQLSAQFNLKSDGKLSVWDSGNWSVNASFDSLNINRTQLNAKIVKVNYTFGDSLNQSSLSVSALGGIDTLLQFYVDASADLRDDSLHIVANTLLGKLYGVSLTSLAPVHVVYSPEAFAISPASFYAGFNGDPGNKRSKVLVGGTYSLEKGADLQFKFANFALASLQRLARLDTNSLKVKGEVSGDASLEDSDSGTVVSINFKGNDIDYNGARAKLVDGNVNLNGNDMGLFAQLSKENDSTSYTLRLSGTVPLSSASSKNLRLDLDADSLDVSFLTPLLSGVQDFGGLVSGGMAVTGKYTAPDLSGKLSVSSGRIRLAVNEINYLFDGTIVGQGDKLVLSPLVIRNVPGENGGRMEANGSLKIGRNTIEEFNIGFNGSLLVLNSSLQKSVQGIYGTAIVQAGPQGLRLGGSLSRPLIEGTIIPSGNLTLLPIQRSENSATPDIVYHFPIDTSAKSSREVSSTVSAISQQTESSGTILDSLKYSIKVETKDNVDLRMIFDPATNQELDAVLGGRLDLSNLSGTMELMGDVTILDNSYYDFYNKQFTASGKLHFTGVPLNPTLDITAQYQGYHYADTSNTKPQVVVVQLTMTGTFSQPNLGLSLTVDNSPFQGDPQTNAVSFILFNQFEDEVTPSQKQTVANNIVSQAGVGVLASYGSSLVSGILTNLLGRQFSFIRSAGLEYNPNSSIIDPNLEIVAQIGNATVRAGGQVGQFISDISNSDVSVDYPLAEILGNRLYLQLSRKVSLSNRLYYQRETINMLRLFYQLSF